MTAARTKEKWERLSPPEMIKKMAGFIDYFKDLKEDGIIVTPPLKDVVNKSTVMSQIKVPAYQDPNKPDQKQDTQQPLSDYLIANRDGTLHKLADLHRQAAEEKDPKVIDALFVDFMKVAIKFREDFIGAMFNYKNGDPREQGQKKFSGSLIDIFIALNEKIDKCLDEPSFSGVEGRGGSILRALVSDDTQRAYREHIGSKHDIALRFLKGGKRKFLDKDSDCFGVNIARFQSSLGPHKQELDAPKSQKWNVQQATPASSLRDSPVQGQSMPGQAAPTPDVGLAPRSKTPTSGGGT